MIKVKERKAGLGLNWVNLKTTENKSSLGLEVPYWFWKSDKLNFDLNYTYTSTYIFIHILRLIPTLIYLYFYTYTYTLYHHLAPCRDRSVCWRGSQFKKKTASKLAQTKSEHEHAS